LSDAEESTASATRTRLGASPALRLVYRVGVAVIGTLVLVAGIVMIPYPGPGWLVVFAGLAILATEFAWARRVLHYVRGHYDAWTAWLQRQTWWVKLLVIAGTGIVVVLTLWLLNGFGLLSGWVGLPRTWLRSPLA
jgi:uncharacterized protein (TIGR02611 family)